MSDKTLNALTDSMLADLSKVQAPEKRGPGRPREVPEDSIRLQVTFSLEQLDALDRWRDSQGITSRARALRVLVGGLSESEA